ncbi:hypothetical protein HX817_10715 [Pseudomonas sp. C6002]|uniref:hypothetical protein n=1 Tax=Pseudomonas sp. C6002 TaxID=2738814 RepID=UPI0015A481B1|nr:hypothetical protein [Pseudomonas sp. C6002]NWA32009.1 hypothetical protein [Pseudomonas sp. C6002]
MKTLINITDCFLALQRLLTGRPIRIKGPYKINNDTVALEAGHPRGSIKKYNPTHDLLIQTISEHYGKKFKTNDKAQQKISDAKEKIKSLEKEINEALGREAMYIKYTLELEAALRKAGNVTPIR